MQESEEVQEINLGGICKAASQQISEQEIQN
jgi:hypothetical protein